MANMILLSPDVAIYKNGDIAVQYWNWSWNWNWNESFLMRLLFMLGNGYRIMFIIGQN